MASVTLNPALGDRPAADCMKLSDGAMWVYVTFGDAMVVHLPDKNRRCLEYGQVLVAALSSALDRLRADLEREAGEGS